MKEKKIYRRFRDPIFKIDIHLMIGTQEDVKKFADNLNLSEYSAGGCWKIERKNEDGGVTRSFLVWLTGVEEFYHMVHETLHLTKMIFDLFGVLFTSQNDEMIAYYQCYWVRKFWHTMSQYIDYKSKPKRRGKRNGNQESKNRDPKDNRKDGMGRTYGRRHETNLDGDQGIDKTGSEA